MKNIIITGSNGFIGSNLVNSLSKQNKLILLIRVKKKPKKNKYLLKKNISYRYFRNNVELENVLKKIKGLFLIHCATHYVKEHSFEDISKMTLANIEFGNILLENLKLMQAKKFINFSTVWQNYNGIEDSPYNLYSATKNSFGKIINFYKNKHKEVKFYNVFISDTYGKNDKRNKLINFLSRNYFKKKSIKIISKNLYINLLNVKDIVAAINIILYKKIKSGNYNLTNRKNFKILNILNEIKKNKKTKLKINWMSKKKINEKIYKFKKLPYWKPKFSSFSKLIEFILRQS